MEELKIDVPEGATPEQAQAAIEEQLRSEPRPDEILLSRVIEMLEANIGAFNFEDVISREGDIVAANDQSVQLYELEANMQIMDKDRPEDGDLDIMFTEFFEPVALGFKRMIEDEGHNVCRPIGITDNELTAREGVFQLCLAGDKISIYMCHKYIGSGEAAYTDVFFRILVGNV